MPSFSNTFILSTFGVFLSNTYLGHQIISCHIISVLGAARVLLLHLLIAAFFNTEVVQVVESLPIGRKCSFILRSQCKASDDQPKQGSVISIWWSIAWWSWTIPFTSVLPRRLWTNKLLQSGNKLTIFVHKAKQLFIFMTCMPDLKHPSNRYALADHILYDLCSWI